MSSRAIDLSDYVDPPQKSRGPVTITPDAPAQVTITPDAPPRPLFDMSRAQPIANAPLFDMSKATPVDLSAGMVPKQPSSIDLSAGMVAKPSASASSAPLDLSQYVDQAPSKTSPSLWDKAKQAGATFWDTLPGVGTAHVLSGALEQWAEKHEPLNNPTSASSTPLKDALKQFATGSLADTAGLIQGATSPRGVATGAAAIAAPEVVAPALIGHGIYSGIQSWGSLKDPDVLQNELNSAAEVAGGASLGAEAIRSGGGAIVRGIRAGRAEQVPVRAAADFTNAVPPAKSTPYNLADYQAARPYLESEHAGSPIETVTQLRDAANSAIGKIEDQIEGRISSLPNARFKTNVLPDVQQALQGNPRGQSFVDAGLKELDDFNFSQPKTLAEADAIRKQLNAENKAVLQKNSYDTATARATDPAFAAREAAAESLRDGIYNQLGANGMPQARQLRLDEGSLIKIRNAAQNQAFNGERVVGASRNAPLAWTMRKAGRIAGAGIGASIGGPGGAIAGEYIGDTAASALAPSGMTRDSLIKRSLAKSVASPTPQATPAAVPLPAAATSAAVATPAVAGAGTPSRVQRLGQMVGSF